MRERAKGIFSARNPITAIHSYVYSTSHNNGTDGRNGRDGGGENGGIEANLVVNRYVVGYRYLLTDTESKDYMTQKSKDYMTQNIRCSLG